MDPFDSEIEDARQIAKRLSLLPQGFKFKVTRDDIQTGGGTYVLHAKIRVTFHDITIEYEAGHGLAWLDKFEDDLRAGWRGAPIFKQPKPKG